LLSDVTATFDPSLSTIRCQVTDDGNQVVFHFDSNLSIIIQIPTALLKIMPIQESAKGGSQETDQKSFVLEY